DVVLAAHAPVAFVDPAMSCEQRLLSQHGRLTADELLVPLLAAYAAGLALGGETDPSARAGRVRELIDVVVKLRRDQA
ncbi:MAG: hypothetical protein ACREMR_02255, partial [Gemmatimonadales bacterium]